MWTYAFSSLWCTLRSGVVGLYNLFNISRNFRTLFQSSCTILHVHQKCMKIQISPHSCQHLLLSVFLILVTLIRMKLYLVVLTCTSISLITNDVEHLSMCLFAICYPIRRNIFFNTVILLWFLAILSSATLQEFVNRMK